MPRPRTHDVDTVLDATRSIVLAQGARAATVAAIAKASGAPTGSLYHAFKTRDQILAAAWGRAARRSQEQWLVAAQHADPIEAGVNMALALLTFAREHTEDTHLLLGMRLEDLTDGPAELGTVNDPVVATIDSLAARLTELQDTNGPCLPRSTSPTGRSAGVCSAASRHPRCSTGRLRPRRAPSSKELPHEDSQRPRAHAADRRRRGLGTRRLARHARRPAVAAALAAMRRTEAIAQHAFVKYHVVGREPGQSLRFRFRDMPGFDGEHAFEVLPAGDGASVLRHTLTADAKGPIELGWRLYIRRLHDALLEDLLDGAEGRPQRRHGLRVRIFRFTGASLRQVPYRRT